jgi:hypothetical protein
MNNQTQEALHKALKVLNCLNNDRVYETAWVKGAINACEEALAQPTVAELNDEYLRDTNVIGLEQPAQEPVALIKHENGNYSPKHQWQEPYGYEKDGVFYYNKPDNVFIYNPLYTHPHQWQGLTDDEINRIRRLFSPINFLGIIRAIEAELKEKNT